MKKLQQFCLNILISLMILDSGKILVHKIECVHFTKTEELEKEQIGHFKMTCLETENEACNNRKLTGSHEVALAYFCCCLFR